MDSNSLIAEVLFYMLLKIGDVLKPVAMVSFYGAPHKELYAASSKTYWTAQHLRDDGVRVIDIKAIKSVVMMAPDQGYQRYCQDGTGGDRWYMMEKPGIKLAQMFDLEEEITEE
jgi:hypothetical protein